ncbi:hypothetical protein ES288_D08G278400v1 [Gossypium darwinii]|uniref:Thylakoid lumenal 17.4 kDa protein, chloroplastic n=1 Tax=Gossypium darwinii TaxID=34276 RepID=A0A5D2BSS6_GOSDA|nr:hypothetical protein ES288_D08G278400v1 [Gossypium darwinii]
MEIKETEKYIPSKMVTLSTPLSHNSLSSPELSTKRHGCPLHQPMYLSESPVLLLRLPPLSTELNRCERAFVGNTIGQANGVYDKPLDLRFCDYTNEESNLKGKSLTAALMSDAKFDGADMSEAVMSKAYAVGASFKDFLNAVLDRVNFGKANLQGAIFKNTLEDAVFEDTIIGYIDLQKRCTNTSISAERRVELGCR